MANSALATNTPPPREVTFEEWYALDEDDGRELVDGVLVEGEMPNAIHEVILSWLNFVIRGWLAPRGGMVLGSGLRVVVSAKHGRVPDLVVYLSDERLPPRDGLVRAPADIFVEVISKSPSDGRRDRIEKTREYAAFAVPFYWLVDPRERSLTILKLNEDKQYALVFVASDGKHEQIPGCPDLTLDLDALWAEVDRLPEE